MAKNLYTLLQKEHIQYYSMLKEILKNRIEVIFTRD